MIVDLSFLGSDTMISGVLAFLAGLASVMVYSKVKNALAGRRYRADEAVIEAVVLEYTHRLRDYDRVIADLRTRVDIIEVKSPPPQSVISQQQMSREPPPHMTPASEPVTVTQHATVENEGNGTTDYILKLLAEKPRTSREVQLAVGRTREHTARLMKRLHDFGLVSRDVSGKPFKYNITDAGRERLQERAAPAAV